MNAFGSNWEPLLLSFKLGAFSTLFCLLAGFPLAARFARSRGRLSAVAEALCGLPLVLPPTVLGFYLLVLLAPKGPVGNLLDALGLPGLLFSFPGLVLGCAISNLPFMVQSLAGGIQGLGPAVWEGAASIGKGAASAALRVVLPAIGAQVLGGVLLCFARSLGEFGLVLMIGGSIPGETRTLSIALFEQVESMNYGAAHSTALLLLGTSFPAVIALTLLRKREGRRTW